MSSLRSVLVAGAWKESVGSEWFEALDPVTGRPLERFPTSPWPEIDRALDAGTEAFDDLQRHSPETIARFLDAYARLIEEESADLASCAASETGLPSTPRFVEVEIPRTVSQLRLAAEAARLRTWVEPTLSPEARIASWMAPIPGVVCVFGPNNFPFAFNGICGGDFASAFATGHPVLAKANPGHPETTRLLATLAVGALEETGLPPASVQLIYRSSHADGRRLVADPRVAATAYTGSRAAGLDLKSHADAAGKPIYLEMSSVNPVIVLPGALRERADDVASEISSSLLLGTGQFCTSPGLLFVIESEAGRAFLDRVGCSLEKTPSGTLLGLAVAEQLQIARMRWEAAGAEVAYVGAQGESVTSFPNTIMQVSGKGFLARHEELQAEAFGNLSLAVLVEGPDELLDCVRSLEGNLTGTIFSAADGSDDADYAVIAHEFRRRVGRLLNDKTPTGVAVVPAMNHGGPYPSTGHPGFTAVGIPASLRRFGMLQCYDNVPDRRLPPELRSNNPVGLIRRVDQTVTDQSIEWGRAFAG